MAKGILGQKVGMTQVYDNAGNVIPVTVIQAGPCHVLQLRTEQKDGYEAVQLGFLDKPRRLAIRSQRGHVAAIASKRSKERSGEALPKADCEPKRFIRELRGPVDGYEVGQEIRIAEMFETDEERAARQEAEQQEIAKARKEKRQPKPVQTNDKIKAIDVTATSKGRGFAGVMKRHNFSGQRATHGVKKVHRHAGSTGCSAYPSRTFKGKRMAGQYGNAKVTVRNLQVVKVDADNNLLLVKGAVPGANGAMVVIAETNMK